MAEFKAVHQYHGTAEYAFAIDELPSLIAAFPGEDLVKKFKGPIDAYKIEAQKHLKLYPGVKAALKRVRDSGCTIAAYTESMDIYTVYRLDLLGLDGVLDFVFTSPDHDVPVGYDSKKISSYTIKSASIRKTKHLTTPEGERKPNPHILLDIVEQVGGLPTWTAYVGDSRWKDIHMAQEAHIYECHAAYGTAHLNEEYALLKKVTDWSDDDVSKEASIDTTVVNASVTLEKRFDEIFQYVEFVEPGSEAGSEFETLVSNQVELWKQTVSVQMHFNEIEMKIRNLALTFVGVAISAAGLSLKEKMTVGVFGGDYPLAALLCIGTSIVLISFWFMDRLWYHRLLNGSIKHGMDIENRLSSFGLVARLTESIGKESPVDLGFKRFHSKAKISFFYFSLSAVLSIAGCFLVSSKVGMGAFVAWMLVATYFYLTQPNADEKHSQNQVDENKEIEVMDRSFETNAILITVLALIMMPVYTENGLNDVFDVWDMSLSAVAFVFGLSFLYKQIEIDWASRVLGSLISGVGICIFGAGVKDIFLSVKISKWLEASYIGLPTLFLFCIGISGIIYVGSLGWRSFKRKSSQRFP